MDLAGHRNHAGVRVDLLLEELELSPEDLFEGEGFAAFSDSPDTR